MTYYNKFRQNNNLTSKKNTPQKFVIREEEFPALGNTSFESLSKKNIENFRSILLTQQIGNDETEKRKIKYGWVDLSFENNNSGKIIKAYNKNYNPMFENENENENENDLDPYILSLNVTNAINTMTYRWENYVIEYNDLFGEDAYEEFYKFGSEYMKLDNDDYSSDDEE